MTLPHSTNVDTNTDIGTNVNADTNVGSAVSERVAVVERAAQSWAESLRDMTKRNRLIFYKDLKTQTLDLSAANPAALRKLLKGATVRLTQLFTASNQQPASVPKSQTYSHQQSREDARHRLRNISSRVRVTYEEKGIETLFLTLGMATWTPEDPSRVPNAPVLIRPASLTRTSLAENDFELSAAEDSEWEVSDELLHHLRSEFGVKVSSDDLLPANANPSVISNADTQQVYNALSKAMEGIVPGFSTRKTFVLGSFMYRKMPIVKDIENNLSLLAGNDLIAAIAGHEDAITSFRSNNPQDVSLSQPDFTPPESEYLVLDADSSQNAIINAVLAGESCVMQGPPGTGKSQTIANLIATMMAEGKKVLFVAEKRAAIDAVLKRLDMVGLSEFVLDMHGRSPKQTKIAKQVNTTFDAIEAAHRVGGTNIHSWLSESRTELSDHRRLLHDPLEPWEISYFDLCCRLLTLGTDGDWERFNPSTLQHYDPHTTHTVRGELQRWASLSAPLRSQNSAWASAWEAKTLRTTEDVSHTITLLDELDQIDIRALSAQRRELMAALNAPTPDSVDSWDDLMWLLAGVSETLDVVTWELYERDLAELENDLQPLQSGAISRGFTRLFSKKYRAAWKIVHAHHQPGTELKEAHVLRMLQEMQSHLRKAQELGCVLPSEIPPNLNAAASADQTVRAKQQSIATILGDDAVTKLPLEELWELTRQLLADESVNRLPSLIDLEERLTKMGVERILRRTIDGELPASHLDQFLVRSLLMSIRRQHHQQHPSLGSFNRSIHSQHVAIFSDLDTQNLEEASARIRQKIRERALAIRDEHPTQYTLIRREANKKRRLLPLRKLFEEAPDMLTAVLPCWTMSPLDVASALPHQQLFDLVVFDEASQVQPCDAISSIARAAQVLVAGDSKQLPPTTFFAGLNTEIGEMDEESITDFESILDVLDTILRRRSLTWHYRSEDERLIAFSNRHFYDSRLTTFPGALAAGCLKHELVPHRPEACTMPKSNSDEVNRVVELMIEHAQERPHETLGVITMGIDHARRIEETLFRELANRDNLQLEEFFDEKAEEDAFVKNLERVQGDERDAIILSIGYGKQPDGRLLHRFGPLNSEGGGRRLNVAVTRARKRVTLVSSFAPNEIDPARCKAEGAKLLAEYLIYAASGGNQMGQGATVTPLNAFESDVKDKLERAGLDVVPQYGCSGYRIDFAVRHPDKPGEFVLAVEADGASYHSLPTVRDRDRLRQQHLERLGWTFCRIWSTDWFNNSSKEVDRVVHAYQKALANSTQEYSHLTRSAV